MQQKQIRDNELFTTKKFRLKRTASYFTSLKAPVMISVVLISMYITVSCDFRDAHFKEDFSNVRVAFYISHSFQYAVIGYQSLECYFISASSAMPSQVL
jgi:hypothetical protein